MSVALSLITDTMLWILRETWFSTAYPQLLCELFANSSQQDILSGRVIHPLTKEEAQAWTLHFLNTDMYYNNVKPTTLTTDTTAWATTIYADTTDYPATWSLYLGGQAVDYISITQTTFVLDPLTPIDYPYIAWQQVSICFKLPTNFWQTISCIYNNKFALPQKSYDTLFNDLNVFKGSNAQRNNLTSYYEDMYNVAPFYTIKDTTYLIIFQLNETDRPIHFRYKKTAPTMTSTWLTPVWSIIDNDVYAQLCISELAVAQLLFYRWEENRAWQIFNLAISDTRKLYSWYDDIEYESQNAKSYSVWHGKRNI